jgi:hypothetical protein
MVVHWSPEIFSSILVAEWTAKMNGDASSNTDWLATTESVDDSGSQYGIHPLTKVRGALGASPATALLVGSAPTPTTIVASAIRAANGDRERTM